MSPTSENIARKALNGAPDRWHINKADVEVFCQQEQITTSVFRKKFARYIVQGYVSGRFNWLSCDTAVNSLSAVMAWYGLMPEFPWGVFLAFDAGECHPDTPTLTPDQVTRPMIDKFISKYRIA